MMTKQRRSRWLWAGLGIVGVLAILVGWRWPSFEIRAWTPPPMPPATGVWKENRALVKVEMLGSDKMIEPEDPAVDTKGRVYGGCLDGKIWRISPDGKSEVFADTKGRPLGLVFGSDGVLYVADAVKGLLAVDEKGKVRVLVDRYDNKPFLFTDDLDIDTDGTIYFSDASMMALIHGQEVDVVPDILSRVPTGRLFKYEPKTKKLTLLRDKLFFANGVVLSHDRSFVLVTETADYRVSRYWLKGPKKGQLDTFTENLRGFPDNINRSSDGGYWVALTTPRLPDVEKKIHPRVWLKKFLFVLPKALMPKPLKVSLVVKLDANGKVVQTLQEPTGKIIANATSAYEANGYLYLGHIYHRSPRIGRYKLPGTGKP